MKSALLIAALFATLLEKVNRIMATSQQTLQVVEAVKQQLMETNQDVSTLMEKIAALETAAAADEVPDTVITALNEVLAFAQGVNARNPNPVALPPEVGGDPVTPEPLPSPPFDEAPPQDGEAIGAPPGDFASERPEQNSPGASLAPR